MHHVTSCKATYVRCVCVCLAVACYLHFWQNDRDLLRATAVTRGGTDTEIRVSTEDAGAGEENCPAAPAGIRTRDLLITSPAL